MSCFDLVQHLDGAPTKRHDKSRSSIGNLWSEVIDSGKPMADTTSGRCLQEFGIDPLMFGALFKTIGMMGRPYFLIMLLLPLLITAAAFGVFFVIIGYLLSATAFVSIGWLDVMLDWTAGLGTLVLAWFLFPALLPLVASVFLEQVAGRIEQREYGLEEPPSLPVSQEVVAGAKFAGFSLFLNLIMLPLYLVPVLMPVIYYALNSYLLGREFFESVAGRHMGRKAANALRREHRLLVLFSGLIITLCANLPLATLIAPMIGIAVAVHLVQSLVSAKDKSSPLTVSPSSPDREEAHHGTAVTQTHRNEFETDNGRR